MPLAPLGPGATRRSPLPRFVPDPACLQGAVRESGAEEAPRSRSCALVATVCPSDGLPDLGARTLVNMSTLLLSACSGLQAGVVDYRREKETLRRYVIMEGITVQRSDDLNGWSLTNTPASPDRGGILCTAGRLQPHLLCPHGTGPVPYNP